jgi:flagellar hook-length control protein FliK
MSDLSATLSQSAATLPGLRAANTASSANTVNTTPGKAGDAPRFSDVLKDKSSAIDKPAQNNAKPNNDAERSRERAESAHESESAQADTGAASTASAPADEGQSADARVAANEAQAAQQSTQDAATQAATKAAMEAAQAQLTALMLQLPAVAPTLKTAPALGQVSAGNTATIGESSRSTGADDATLALADKASGDAPLTTAGNSGRSAGQGDPRQSADAALAANLANAQSGTNEPTPGIATATAAISADDEIALPVAAAESAPADTPFSQALTRVREGQSIDVATGTNTHVARSEASSAMRTPVGHPNWSNELGDKMTWMVTQQRSQADLVLNPPQLGRIEVSLTVTGDQANAVFSSPNAAVREMIENSLPRLREILAGSGLNLGQADVGAQSFAQQQQAQQDQQQAATNRRLASADFTPGLDLGAGVATLRSGTGVGMVDTFV